MIAVEKDCAGDAKICDELPPDHQPTFLNGFYYAAQTMTTTGYGSGIVLKTKRTQLVSVLAMPITALWWGIEIALIYDAVKDAVSRRRAGG
ncbi:MAG TPA: ion channel [Polyangia bacterium]|nr:ion channel [Polyangia bacterium]